MFSLGIRIGKYAEADRDSTYKTWDENLIDAADTVDKTVEDARSRLKRISDQTIEVLGFGR